MYRFSAYQPIGTRAANGGSLMKSIPHSATATVSSTMCVLAAAVLLASAAPAAAQVTPEVKDVTFTRDIAPILQRSCQRCHRHESVAPMSLLTYEDARPWARSIKYRTGLRNKPEAMPPWYIEKDVGIQRFKGDLSLTEEEIAKIAWWADNGAARGNPADLPPPLEFTAANEWQIGEPDLILSSTDIEVAARAPDWWGPTGEVATGLLEDRHVAAMEMKEIGNAEPAPNKQTVGGSYVIHHMVITAVDAEGKPVEDVGANVGWPAHEVGRNADFFPPQAGRLLKAGSKFVFPSTHVHSNGRHTVARLDIGLKFHPRGYKPKFALKGVGPGTPYIDLKGMEAGQKFEALAPLMENTMLTVFEPHLHAAGVRMCLEAIWGAQVETLNCAGYNHSWVTVYAYEDDATPLLPKGTILRATAWFDTSPANKNISDPRNWTGMGHRSVDQMLLHLGRGIELSDEEFELAMAERRQTLDLQPGQIVPGCPLCPTGLGSDVSDATDADGGQQ